MYETISMWSGKYSSYWHLSSACCHNLLGPSSPQKSGLHVRWRWGQKASLKRPWQWQNDKAAYCRDLNTHNTELIVKIMLFHGLRFVSHSNGWKESLRLKRIGARQHRDRRSQLVYLVLLITIRCACRNSFLLAKPYLQKYQEKMT